MRWTVSVALSATVLSFGFGLGLGLGFGVGANLGAASATRLVVEKVLSLRDRFLACSGADIDMDTILAWCGPSATGASKPRIDQHPEGDL